ncbi:MAG: hypothetical protein ACE5OY_00830 [Candidatus Bathyarchaeia archaeon]
MSPITEPWPHIPVGWGGTKVLIARPLDGYGTVGIDCVAMN